MATNKQLRDRVYNLEYLKDTAHEDMINKSKDELLVRINELVNLPEKVNKD